MQLVHISLHVIVNIHANDSCPTINNAPNQFHFSAELGITLTCCILIRINHLKESKFHYPIEQENQNKMTLNLATV